MPFGFLGFNLVKTLDLVLGVSLGDYALLLKHDDPVTIILYL